MLNTQCQREKPRRRGRNPTPGPKARGGKKTKKNKKKNTYPILAHQELFKVPLHPLEPQQARRLRLHPLVHRLRLVPVHVRLAEHGEGNAVVAQAEGLDGVVVAGVLLHELVAGEAEDDEAVPVLRPDLLVQLLQRFELRREAALGGRVDYQDDFVLEGGEGVGLAFFCFWGWC